MSLPQQNTVTISHVGYRVFFALQVFDESSSLLYRAKSKQSSTKVKLACGSYFLQSNGTAYNEN